MRESNKDILETEGSIEELPQERVCKCNKARLVSWAGLSLLSKDDPSRGAVTKGMGKMDSILHGSSCQSQGTGCCSTQGTNNQSPVETVKDFSLGS